MIKNFLYKVLCGFLLGLSIFAPGFSGSIIAIIMGIYQDLIRIVSNPFKNLKQNILYCIPLGIGAAISAVLFVIAFKFLFETYEKATYLLFVGLIVGNLPIIFKDIRSATFKKSYLLGGVVAFAMALTLGLLVLGVSSSGITEGATSSLSMFSISGFLAGLTALVPGMSVSMILILTGVYTQLIFIADSLLHLDFTCLVPFGVFGLLAVIGLVLTSKGIKFIFEKYPGLANTAIFGFMSGSLIGIFVQSLKLDDPSFNWFLGGTMLFLGLAVSFLFVFLGKKMNSLETK